MIGCAGIIALVFLPFGVLMALTIPDAPYSVRIAFALMPSGLSFVAAMLLLMRDQLLRTRQLRRIRRKLLNRHDVNELVYLPHLRDADPTLISQTRKAISEFFDVPVEKIHPTDNLRDDLMFQAFEPNFHLFVLYRVIAARRLEPVPSQIVSFNSGGLSTVDDLADEVRRVIDGLKYS
jgi:hypothetical protein